MKFKFCSDGDCPLWALAALNAISGLPSALFKTLLQQVMEEQPDDALMEILKDTSLSSRDESARAAAVIRWVVQQAYACGCGGAQLTRDLLVLGVPRAHATALAEVVDNYDPENVPYVNSKVFMINKMTDITTSSGPDGPLEMVTLTIHSDDAFTGEKTRKDLVIDKAQVKLMVEELQKAYQKMEELEG